jgi:hypothetical protein
MLCVSAPPPNLAVAGCYRAGGDMSEYRAYALDREGHILQRFEFEAEADTRAIACARQFVDRYELEVWTGCRFVGVVRPPAR